MKVSNEFVLSLTMNEVKTQSGRVLVNIQF
jgi:hypothetical protein